MLMLPLQYVPSSYNLKTIVSSSSIYSAESNNWLCNSENRRFRTLILRPSGWLSLNEKLPQKLLCYCIFLILVSISYNSKDYFKLQSEWKIKLTSLLKSPIHSGWLWRAAWTARKACWNWSVMLTSCILRFMHAAIASSQDKFFRITSYWTFW